MNIVGPRKNICPMDNETEFGIPLVHLFLFGYPFALSPCQPVRKNVRFSLRVAMAVPKRLRRIRQKGIFGGERLGAEAYCRTLAFS